MREGAPTGIGLGLRAQIADATLALPDGVIDFVEVHPENYLDHGGYFARVLDRARARWPVLTHGLTGAFGAPRRHDAEYLRAVRGFVEAMGAPFHSDHLCLGGRGDRFLHDLLPIPFDRATRDVVVDRVREAQDAIGLPIALEHLSYYAKMSEDPLDEARFVADVLERADARLLLDVNNVVVNAKNHGFRPEDWLALVPLHRTAQIHVAGHLTRRDGLCVDTHGEAVSEAVFALLEVVLRKVGDVPILLERDENLASIDDVLPDLTRLRAIRARAIGAESQVHAP